MGAVKEAVHGPKKVSPKVFEGNLNDQMQALLDELSRLTAIKDDDTLKEGEAEKPENMRKAGHLRAAFSLVRSAKSLLEDY